MSSKKTIKASPASQGSTSVPLSTQDVREPVLFNASANPLAGDYSKLENDADLTDPNVPMPSKIISVKDVMSHSIEESGVNVEALNSAVEKALSYSNATPDSKIRLDMTSDELEQYFTELFAKVTMNSTAVLQPEVATIRRLAHTIELNVAETREIQGKVLKMIEDGSAEKVVAKTVKEVVVNPVGNFSRIIDGLMTLGTYYKNAKGKTLEETLKLIGKIYRPEFLESCSGKDQEGIKLSLQTYMNKSA